jgi:hypothetical protein
MVGSALNWSQQGLLHHCDRELRFAAHDDRCPAASDPALQYRRGCDAMHWDGRLKKGSVGA